jgi:two-component system phosphate regulon sensor histidine kinase PhoR
MSNTAFVFALAAVLLAGVFAWLDNDFAPGHRATAFFKLLATIAGFSAAIVTYLARAARQSSGTLARFTEFVGAVPQTQPKPPGDVPAEFQALAKALRIMAERVREIFERANVELSRRETILACLAEGVLAVDAELRVIFCNHAFERAFDIPRPAAEGTPLLEVVREPLLLDILERVIRQGAPQSDRIQLLTAATRWFQARTMPLGNEPVRGAVIVLHDITDIEREEQVRKDFVADVSHELRTPLAAIRGFAETLLDGALEDKENNRRFVETILAHAIRLNNIASDLLVISELDRGTLPQTPPERVRILDVIQSAIHTVERAAALRNISIQNEQYEDHAVLGYRFRLEQVMVNLLDNAVKFNRPQGAVRLSCTLDDQHRVCVTVADNGIGIPSTELRNIFERFYRVDKSRSRPAGGTGLGLPIVKEVVESMGGTVAVESQLGRGSKFVISLPAA